MFKFFSERTPKRRHTWDEHPSTTSSRPQSIKGQPLTDGEDRLVLGGSPQGYDPPRANVEQRVAERLATAPHHSQIAQASSATVSPPFNAQHSELAQQSTVESSFVMATPPSQAKVKPSVTSLRSSRATDPSPAVVTLQSQIQMDIKRLATAQSLQTAEGPLSQTIVGQQPRTDAHSFTTAQQNLQRCETSSIDTSSSPVNAPLQSCADIEHSTTTQQPSQAVETSTVVAPLFQTDSETALGPQVSIEHRTIVSIDDLEPDDVVIVVMGPTGFGKSSFISITSGLDIQGVGHTLKLSTRHVQAIRFWHRESGRHVVLVDTPGLDDTFRSYFEILGMIANWLNSSYKKDILLSGILYLHRITDSHMTGTLMKNLRIFRKLCGQDALDKVWLTTTMWDEVDPEVGEGREATLKKEYWKSMIDQGAHVARCRSDDDSPKQIIQQIINQGGARKALLLQKEMVKLMKELKETEAGQELYTLEELIDRQANLLQKINRERKMVSDPGVLAELQAEYDDLGVQIHDKSRQQELKSPWFQTLTRFYTGVRG